MLTELSMRASDAPTAFKCPGSIRAVSLSVAESSEASDLGSAVHEASRPLAEGIGIQWDELTAIAERWGCDPDDLHVLVGLAHKFWPTVAADYPNALTEVPLQAEIAPGVMLTGHVDVLAGSGRIAQVLDWKSGRKDRDYSHQLKAYGALVLLDDPALEAVVLRVFWIRDSDLETYTMTRADLDAWLRSFRETVVEWDGVYRAGPHCQHCRRSHECTAANALARRDIAALLDTEAAAAIEAMSPDQVVELYRRAAHADSIAKRIKAAIKAHVETHGEVTSTDGRLVVVTEERRKLDPKAVWPVLESEGFRDEDFAAVIDVSVTRVEDRIAERAGRGKGAAAVRALKEKLAAAGAVRINEIHKLTEKR